MTGLRAGLLAGAVSAAFWAACLTGLIRNADLLALGPAVVGILLLGGFGIGRTGLRSRPLLLGVVVFVLIGLSVNFIVRPYGAANLNPQNALKLLVWVGLPLLCAPYWRQILAGLGDRAVALFAVYGVIGFASALYSPVPAYSAACGLSLIAYLGFACVLAQEFDAALLVKLGILALVPYLAANWLSAAISPATALMAEPGLPRLQGLSGQPNNLGDQAAGFLCLVIVAGQAGWLTRRLAYGVLLPFGLVTLLATQSRTALLSVLGAGALVWLRRRRVLLPGLLALGLAAPLVVDTVGLRTFSRNDHSQQIMTLTGRTQLWAFAWTRILQRPLLGHGLNSFQAAVVDEWYGNPGDAVETHNNALSVLFSVGLFGFLPVAAAYGVLLTRWFTAPDLLRDLFVLRALIEGVAEASLSMATMTLLLFFLALAIAARADIPGASACRSSAS